jgi:hypothetical protein
MGRSCDIHFSVHFFRQIELYSHCHSLSLISKSAFKLPSFDYYFFFKKKYEHSIDERKCLTSENDNIAATYSETNEITDKIYRALKNHFVWCISGIFLMIIEVSLNVLFVNNYSIFFYLYINS